MSISSKIRKMRQEKGFTQEYMAEKLGMTQSAYCKIERDDRKINFDKITRIAVILETNMVSIFEM